VEVLSAQTTKRLGPQITKSQSVTFSEGQQSNKISPQICGFAKCGIGNYVSKTVAILLSGGSGPATKQGHEQN